MDDGIICKINDKHFIATTTSSGAPKVLSHMEEFLQTEWPHLQVYLNSITEQFTTPNITGGILSIDPNYYKYGSAITNSGMAVKKNINVGLDFRIDDIFIAKNTNTVYTTDKVNGASYYPDYYKQYIGVGTNNPIASLDISSMKNAMMLPVGNETTEKPTGHPGMIRYNNEIFDYEGRGRNEWGTLGGIQDIDMNTKIELFVV